MRTTVTLDSDTEHLLRERMRRDGVSFKQALNDAVRSGSRPAQPPKPFRTQTYDLGEPRVDLTHANRVVADLEDEAILERMRADG